MKKMFDRAADLGVESIVIEMSHRGRLNIARWWCESASLSKVPVILSVSDNTGTAAFLAFDMEGGVQVPEAVAPGLDARVVNAGKVAEQASTSDGSHPELSAPAKERFAEDEKALKKARLE
ncbi:hypothetical protein Bca52824_090003 [Brassica carinata]|uniref:Uncharacterized protein n=1 Tax=Brassica carinata TaxID=52824 RepID=A0A8X7NW01_BRACI|nr:hypothetical protein Bca52824_090003 [Brassica carinata]